MTKNQIKKIDNFEINEDKGHLVILINSKIFPLNIVNSACYIFTDKASITLNGDPEKEILVKMRRLNKNENLEQLGIDFNNELLNYSVYLAQFEKTKVIKEAIVLKSLFTSRGENELNYSETTFENNEVDEAQSKASSDIDLKTCNDNSFKDSNLENDSLGFEDDPLGIATPWADSKENNEVDEAQIPSKSCNNIDLKTCNDDSSINLILKDDSLSFEDDPLGIATPWTEPKENSKKKKRK